MAKPRPVTTRDLSRVQQRLVHIMSRHQFGRIENMVVRAGQPVLDPEIRVVHVVRLGGDRGEAGVPRSDGFELKQPVRDLLEVLERLQDGIVVRLEFRHGLPCLIETTVAVTPT